MHCERRLCNSVYALVREYGLRTCLVDHKVQGAMELCERGVDGCFITHWLKQEGRFWGGCEPIFGTNCDPNRHCYHCEGTNCNTVEKFKEAFYCYIKDNKGNIKLGNVCGAKICYVYIDDKGKDTIRLQFFMPDPIRMNHIIRKPLIGAIFYPTGWIKSDRPLKSYNSLIARNRCLT
uniref:Uncharacterized protein n=1 Tax=Meloidogyne incognita TaxID=6306 RepID=A0A914KFT3_MELIC